MSKLYRTSRFYRTLSVDVNDKRYEICSFIFYNEDGVIFKYNHGFLDNDMELDFDFEIKRKVKESFCNKVAYILKSSSDREGRYDLYIHSDLVGLKNPKYKRDYNMIFATYETNIKGFDFKIYIKSLDRELNIVKKQIEEEGKKLSSFRINSESLKDVITKLQELQVKLKEEEDCLDKYTVEDYLNEIKEVK